MVTLGVSMYLFLVILVKKDTSYEGGRREWRLSQYRYGEAVLDGHGIRMGFLQLLCSTF